MSRKKKVIRNLALLLIVAMLGSENIPYFIMPTFAAENGYETQTEESREETEPEESETEPEGSETEPEESETEPEESETEPEESETEPEESETEPAESETEPAESETEPEESETEPEESETEPAESETEPEESETEPAESETEPEESETEPEESETAPAESESAPAESETAPAESESAPAESETAPVESLPELEPEQLEALERSRELFTFDGEFWDEVDEEILAAMECEVFELPEMYTDADILEGESEKPVTITERSVKINGKEFNDEDVLEVTVGAPFSYEFEWSFANPSKVDSFSVEVFKVPGLNLASYRDQPAVIYKGGRNIKIGTWSLIYDSTSGVMTFKMKFSKYASMFTDIQGFKQGSGKFNTALENGEISVGDSIGSITIVPTPPQPPIENIPDWSIPKPPAFDNKDWAFGKGKKWDSSVNNSHPETERVEWRGVYINDLQKLQKELIEENKDKNSISIECLSVSNGNYIIEDTLDQNQRFLRSYDHANKNQYIEAPFYFEIPVVVAGTGNFLLDYGNGSGIGNGSYDGPGIFPDFITAEGFTQVTEDDVEPNTSLEDYVRANPMTWALIPPEKGDGSEQKGEKLIVNIGKLGVPTGNTEHVGLAMPKSVQTKVIKRIQNSIDVAQKNITDLKAGNNAPVVQLKSRTEALETFLRSIDVDTGIFDAFEAFEAWYTDNLDGTDEETGELLVTGELPAGLEKTGLWEAMVELLKAQPSIGEAEDYQNWENSYVNIEEDQQEYVAKYNIYLDKWNYALNRYQLTKAFYEEGRVYGFVFKYTTEILNTAVGTYSNRFQISTGDVSYDAEDTEKIKFKYGMTGNYALGSIVLRKADSRYESFNEVTDTNGLAGAKFLVYDAHEENGEWEFEAADHHLNCFADQDASASGNAYVWSHHKEEANGENSGIVTEEEAITKLEVDENGVLAIESLYPDHPHYLVEVESPEGYYLNSSPIRFDLEEEKVVYQLIPNVSRAVKLTKASSYDHTPVGGAEFTLYNASTNEPMSGFTKTSFTSNGKTTQYYQYGSGSDVLKTFADGELNIHGLPAGSYYLKETAAAPGYVLTEAAAEKKYSFILEAELTEEEKSALYQKNGFYYVLANPDASGQPQAVLNDKETASMTLTKIDGNGAPLTGAEFALLKWTGTDAQWNADPLNEAYWKAVPVNSSSVYFKTQNAAGANGGFFVGQDGRLTFTDIPSGHFAVTEVMAPNGYQRLSGKLYFDVDTGNSEPVQLYWNVNGQNAVAGNRVPNLGNPGSLKVHKLVAGNRPDISKKFLFTISFKDNNGAPLQGTFNYTLTKQSEWKGDRETALAEGKLTLSQEGTYQVPLAHEDAITITGLPEGTSYSVSEEEDPAYQLVLTNGSGTIPSMGVATATARNRYRTGLLRITKNVSGPNAERNRLFEFVIELKNADGTPLTGTYDYMGTANAGIEPPASGSITPDAAGKVTFKLKAGQHITVDGLPHGTLYKITETSVDGYVTKISTNDHPVTDDGSVGSTVITIEGNEIDGSILDNRRDDVDFNNVSAPDPGDLEISKVVDCFAVDTSLKFHFTLHLKDKEGVPVDGVYDTEYRVGGPETKAESGEIVFDETGKAEFELGHLGYLVIKGLPEEAVYSLTEGETPGYESSIGQAATGKIDPTKPMVVVVTNHHQEGNLIVSKIVEGRGGDMNKEFDFRITLKNEKGEPLKGSWRYIGTSISSEIAAPKNGTLDLNADGSGIIKLKHGQRITLGGLPEGTTYKVEELLGTENRYVVIATDDKGTIQNKVESNARFINRFKTGQLRVLKTVTEGELERAFTFSVTLENQTINGIYDEMTFQNGVATFTLKHGESKIATGLPAGTAYTVTETDNKGYSVTTKNASGVIRDEEIVRAEFYNQLSSGGSGSNGNGSGSGGGSSKPDRVPEKDNITGPGVSAGVNPPETTEAPQMPDEENYALPKTGDPFGGWSFLLEPRVNTVAFRQENLAFVKQAKPQMKSPASKDLKELMKKYQGVIGWLKIEGTEVDYPVAQNPEDNEYYLRRDLDGNDSVAGTIYMDSNHDLEERGLHVIYGHNMRNGSMFKDVSKFIDPDYMRKHSEIYLYTGQKTMKLEPMYCYVDSADGQYRRPLKEEELAEFFNERIGQQITGNVYVFITCSYGSKDERTYLICRESE